MNNKHQEANSGQIGSEGDCLPSRDDSAEELAQVQEEADVTLTAAQAAQVAQRKPVPALLIHEIVRDEGEEELGRSSIALISSGFAAGLSISFSVVAQGATYAAMPYDLAIFGLVKALAYTIGFLIVIVARQQLFTENTLTVILPLIAEPSRQRLYRVARLWSIVLLANLAGTLAFAFTATLTPIFSSDIIDGMLKASEVALVPAGLDAFALGVPAGFLIATLVWCLAAARRHMVALILILVGLISFGGFTHVIAGSTEAFLLLLDGRKTAYDAVFGYILPTLGGNVVGGTAIFALLSYAQIFEERAHKRKTVD